MDLVKQMTKDERIHHCKIISNRVVVGIVICFIAFLYFKDIKILTKSTQDTSGKTTTETEYEIAKAIDQIILITESSEQRALRLSLEKNKPITQGDKNIVKEHKMVSRFEDIDRLTANEKLKIVHDKLIDMKKNLSKKNKS